MLYVGQRFNKWTVISFEGCYNNLYLCKCDCGKLKSLRRWNLINNKTQSCQSCRLKGKTSGNKIKDRKTALINTRYAQYRSNAKNDNRVFELTKDFFKRLVTSNCTYCDSPPTGSLKDASLNSTYELRLGGIDRIDSSMGYTELNCVSCCKLCNFMKNNSNQKDFLTHIHKIAKRHVEPRQ